MILVSVVLVAGFVWLAISSGILSISGLGLPFQQMTPTPTATPGTWGYALQLSGNGVNDIDRVKIPIEPQTPADVGEDFTLEWWMKASPEGNRGVAMCDTDVGWIWGSIILDRDIYNAGDFGDYGISLTEGKIAFGVAVEETAVTICGSTVVADGAWHHVAVTRDGTSGEMAIYVDGVLDVSGTGPAGDASYRDGRSTQYPNSDPFLVIGAEKHDAGSDYPSYRGLIDEFRISDVVRYTEDFAVTDEPFTPDENTVALYHFDEGSGTTALDSATVSDTPTNGTLKVGGNPVGPIYVGSDVD